MWGSEGQRMTNFRCLEIDFHGRLLVDSRIHFLSIRFVALKYALSGYRKSVVFCIVDHISFRMPFVRT